MRYGFILQHRNHYPVEKMCTCMKVSKNSYYHWLKQRDTLKAISPKKRLKARIRAIFEESKEIYGSAKVQKQLEREGYCYSRSYVGLLMREIGLKSVVRRKYVVTTDSKHSFPVVANILNRDFSSDVLGEKWVSDITYIRVNNDWNYLTTIIDLADRKVVGWSLSERMTAENTVMKAYLKAKNSRETAPDFLFHSDRGVQYASSTMSNLFLYSPSKRQSMSRKGNCWDNAVAESFFKIIKHEWLYRFTYTSYNQLFESIETYINWYNNKRLHSSLGYLSPLEMEMKLRGNIKQVA